MATNKAIRAATNADSIVRQIQNALDLAERTLNYVDIHGDVVTEILGLTAGEIVTGDLTKERVVDSVVLAANLAFFLRGVADGTNTILGAAPLNAAGLKALIDKLSI